MAEPSVIWEHEKYVFLFSYFWARSMFSFSIGLKVIHHFCVPPSIGESQKCSNSNPKFVCLCLERAVFSLAQPEVHVGHKVEGPSFALAPAVLPSAAVPASSSHLRLHPVSWWTGGGLSRRHQCMAPGPLALEAPTYTQSCQTQVHFNRKTPFECTLCRSARVQMCLKRFSN